MKMAQDDNSNMTIIGGTHGLGRWLAEHLNNDFNIRITSRDESSGKPVAEEIGVEYSNNNIEAIKDADIILFSVPIEHMVETIREVACARKCRDIAMPPYVWSKSSYTQKANHRIDPYRKQSP